MLSSKLNFIISIIILIQIHSCSISKQFSTADIEGRFQRNTQETLEILELELDSTFKYYNSTYSNNKFKVDSCIGKYELKNDEIYFHPQNEKSKCCNNLQSIYAYGPDAVHFVVQIKNNNLITMGYKLNPKLKYKRMKL